MNKKALLLFVSLLINSCIAPHIFALDSTQMEMFAQNNILFYDPDECKSSGGVSICGTNLPAETVEMLEYGNVKENAEKNLERYQYAEEKTGLAWQIVATLHYMEAGMGSNNSISNGEQLYEHTNVDGIHVSADPNQDAKEAAEHFIEMAKWVYDVDVLTDKSVEAYGKAFLAYNRGGMYKCNGDVPYTQSPYVMNFLDDDHRYMTFVAADSLLCDGSTINGVAGSKWSHVGALATLAYLCGNDSSVSSGSSSSSSDSKDSTAQGIADTAKKLAWSESDRCKASSPSGVFTEASESAGTDGSNDSITFVQTVILESGVDKDFPSSGSSTASDIAKHMSESDKWSETVTTNIDSLQAGDILISVDEDNKNSEKNFVFIFLGDNKSASAKRDQWYGRIGNLADEWQNKEKPFYNGDIQYKVFRVKTGDCPNGEFVWYGQCEPEWANSKFGSTTICDAGCGPVTFAMLATILLNKEITPTEVGKIAGDKGMYIEGAGSSLKVTEVLAEHYGLEYEEKSASSAQEAVSIINQYLQDGWLISTAGDGSENYTSSGSGHYVGIRGIADDGNWLVANSASKSYSEDRTWEPLSFVNSGMNIHYIRAIRASSTGADCGNICSNGPTGTNGFKDAKDAEFIINDYLKDNLSSYSLVTPPTTGDKHDNCVAFSVWFIDHFTKITHHGGATGNGNEFVDIFLSTYKSEYPELAVSDQPSVYSVASWSDPTILARSSNHTGIVIGIDEASDKILIAEAGYDNHSFTGVHEYNLSEAKGGSSKYVNLNKYLLDNTGLK